VEDGKQMATMEAWNVRSLAVSKDRSWIAAGTLWGKATMWDAETYEKAFTVEDEDIVGGVDFSPDSTRLLVASEKRRATVWDVVAHKKVLTLHHGGWMRAAKYSPQGDRIATATFDSVRVWDSSDGRLLTDIPVKVTPLSTFNSSLLWSNNHLFVVSDSAIKQLEASTGSVASEWLHHGNNSSSIALPKHGEFIAYSTYDTVTFWNTSTHTRVGLIQHTQPICSIAHSPHHQFLAIGGDGGKIAIKGLKDVVPASYLMVSIVYCRIIAYQNGFTANPPYSNFSSTCKLIASFLSYHFLTLPTLHSIPGSRTGSQTRKHH
jgi:WD40 repeat protein